MKKEELIKVLKDLDEIKSITDKQEYVVSKNVNQLMNSIRPVLNNELRRMDLKEVECNAPELCCITSSDLQDATQLINLKLEELVKNDYKIIDYSSTFNNTIVKPNTYSVIYLGVIKYTT